MGNANKPAVRLLEELENLQRQITGLESPGEADRETFSRLKEQAAQSLRLMANLVGTAPERQTGSSEARDQADSLGQQTAQDQYNRLLGELDQERGFADVVLDSAASLIVVVDHEGRIIRYNRAFRQTTGRSARELRHQTIWELNDDEEARGKLEEFLLRRLASERSRGQIEIKWSSPRGDRWIRWKITPFFAATPGTRLFVLAGSDLTERRQHEIEARRWQNELEEKVRDRTAQLDKANQELELLIYAISHDLRTPLRGIRNYVDFLTMDLGDKVEGEAAEDLERLHRAAIELDSMLGGLLEYSRIGRRHHVAEAVDLNELVEDIARLLAADSDAEVVTEGVLPILQAPLELVQQVFQNLIQNGIVYNRSSPRRVTVTAQKPAADTPGWTIAVRDNGIGIDPQYHDKIFDMFQRLHSDREFRGTGIGLSSARKAVEVLGGSIRLESELGRGTTFFVQIPETWSESSAKAE